VLKLTETGKPVKPRKRRDLVYPIENASIPGATRRRRKTATAQPLVWTSSPISMASRLERSFTVAVRF